MDKMTNLAPHPIGGYVSCLSSHNIIIISYAKSIRGSPPLLFPHPSFTLPSSLLQQHQHQRHQPPSPNFSGLTFSPVADLQFSSSFTSQSASTINHQIHSFLRFLSPRLASDTHLVVILALPHSPPLLPHCFRFVQYLPLKERSRISLAWFEKSELETGFFSSPDSFCTAHFVSAEENCFALILSFTQFFTFYFFSPSSDCYLSSPRSVLFGSYNYLFLQIKRESRREGKEREKREIFYQAKGSC